MALSAAATGTDPTTALAGRSRRLARWLARSPCAVLAHIVARVGVFFLVHCHNSLFSLLVFSVVHGTNVVDGEAAGTVYDARQIKLLY